MKKRRNLERTTFTKTEVNSKNIEQQEMAYKKKSCELHKNPEVKI